ncbi:MAG: NADH-quinone oxidoreductase subunit H [Anaerolineae bacterium]|nr:NADH-quinone oxidoreductase subunit H [Anaerolineae bacterium]
MTTIRWLVQATVWLILYLSLLTAYQLVTNWLIARFQQRPIRTTLMPTTGKNRTRAIVLLVALTAGAMIPLAPAMTVGPWQLDYHLWSHSSIALLAVLIVQWLGETLLAFLDKPGPFSLAWQAMAAILIDALPTLFIVFGLLLTSRQSSLQLTAWIAAQGEGAGLRWMSWTQPLLSLLWLICARPYKEAHTPNTWAHNALAFNRTLLASALFLGGWQGPFVNHWPWLGLLYTAIKAIVVGSIWTWVQVTLPRASLAAHSRMVGHVWVPLVILNLIITALLVIVF